jgi:Secretory lipase
VTGRIFAGAPVRAMLLACLAVALAMVSPAPAGAQPIYPIPDADPFYLQPPDLASKRPGDVIAVRPMPAIASFPGVGIVQIKFRSTNSVGKPIAATTLALLPANRQPGGPLLSYQHIINGLGTKCSPASTLYTSDPNLVVREAPALNVVLSRGWSILLPDHLGPNAAYGAAKLGGQIVLDNIRAAQQVRELGLTDSPVAMAGYSGGGMATAWAAALAASYAPELKIVGAAEGGVPANITKMARQLGFNPHPAFGLAMAAAIGLEREYPERFPLSEQLNPLGIDIRNRIANACTNDILVAGAGHSVPELASTLELTSDPKAWSIADENSLELYPGVPTVPIYEWHSPIDGLIPVDSLINTVARYCAAGVRVQSETYPVPDHLTAAVLGLPAALNYLEQRFQGVPAPSNC